VEWLDEYHSGSFRQAQISFSARIPNAFPLGDAMTMSTHVCLYNSNHSLHYRDVKPAQAADNSKVAGDPDGVGTPLPSVQEEDGAEPVDGEETPKAPASTAESIAGSASEQDTSSLTELLTSAPPLVSMVSKHSNGMLTVRMVLFRQN